MKSQSFLPDIILEACALVPTAPGFTWTPVVFSEVPQGGPGRSVRGVAAELWGEYWAAVRLLRDLGHNP